jgi:hypothetical protein
MNRQSAENPGFLRKAGYWAGYELNSAKLQADQEMRLDHGVQHRESVPWGGTDYRGFSHPELRQMVTENMDPGHVHDAGRAWNDLGNTMVQFSQDLNTAITSSRQSWQGQAAEAAHGYLSTLGNWTGQTGQGMQLMGNRMAIQADAASTAKNAMPEPVNFSVNDALRTALTEQNPFNYPKLASQIEQKFEEKNQAHEQAAQVMTTMAQSLHDSGSTMPAFAAPPPPQDGAGQPGQVQPGGGDRGPTPGGGNHWSGWQVDGPGGRSGGVVGPGGSAQGGPYPGLAPVAGVSTPGDQTSAQGWVPTDAGTNPWSRGGSGGYPSGSGGYPGGYPGGSGDSRFAGGPVGGVPGGFASGSDGEGLAGGRSGGRLGGGSVGRPGVGGNRLGPGGGAGALATEEAAAARAGAAGGRGAGAGGMGGMGAGGRGGKGEDKEHRRPSYLMEGDPDGLFSTDQLTAPPVIGE